MQANLVRPLLRRRLCALSVVEPRALYCMDTGGLYMR